MDTIPDLKLCEQVQLLVWGEAAPEVTAASLRAAVHAGALVVGAFGGGELLGFAFGFPSYVGGKIGLHSHLLAVSPQARGRGLGKALKWFQREWCLARNITRVSWTFDPLQAKNARLNLEHLGAFARYYLPDFYGTLGGALNGELPTDRLLAEWPLDAPHVAALAAGETLPKTDTLPVAALIRVGGEPQLAGIPKDANRVWLELPPRIAPESNFEVVLRWRLALREVMRPLLEHEYLATRFVAGGYVLERQRQNTKNPAEAG